MLAGRLTRAPVARPSAHSLTPLYLGAFLGPFGGNVIQVLFPILQDWYALDVTQLALSVTAYMVPFAAGQFVSGAIADRYGRQRVLVAGFGAFALASLLGAAAPTFLVFLLARAAQGIANACTTPILMAILGDTVDPRRLGRSIGLFGAANTAGLFLAPLLSGLLALWDWRLVYLLLTASSTWLTVYYARWRPGARSLACPPASLSKPLDEAPEAMQAHQPHRSRQSHQADQVSGWRAVLTRRLVLLCLAAMLGYFSLNGVGFLVVLFVTAAFRLDSAQSGLLLSAFGLASMLAAGPAGILVDRAGGPLVSAAGVTGAALILALLPWAPSPATTGLLLLAGGACVAALWAGLTTLAVQAVPARRATASSIFNAWKFVGYAVAPLLYAPLYATFGAAAAFSASAALTFLILPLLAGLAVERRRGAATG